MQKYRIDAPELRPARARGLRRGGATATRWRRPSRRSARRRRVGGCRRSRTFGDDRPACGSDARPIRQRDASPEPVAPQETVDDESRTSLPVPEPELSPKQLLKMLLEVGPMACSSWSTPTRGFSGAPARSWSRRWSRSWLPGACSGNIPIMPLVSGAFVLVFGGLTLLLQDELFIKMKPTIVNCLFAGLLLGGLAFGQNIHQVAVRRSIPPDRGGMACPDGPVGAILPVPGSAQRDRLAIVLDRILDQLQDLGGHAADNGVRHRSGRAASSATRRARMFCLKTASPSRAGRHDLSNLLIVLDTVH